MSHSACFAPLFFSLLVTFPSTLVHPIRLPAGHCVQVCVCVYICGYMLHLSRLSFSLCMCDAQSCC